MKINFSKINQDCISISCRGQIPSKTIGFSDIKKITSDKEYNSLLKNIKGSGRWLNEWVIGNKFEQGLMPYAGYQDISYIINTFMRSGKILDNNYTKFIMESIIKLFDYSLQKIDEIYGKHQGVVYRYGAVNLNSKNYVSASSNPNGAASFVGGWDRLHCSRPFHIIQIKNGHKVSEVQKKLNYMQQYVEESEIITEPTHFEYVDNPSVEMLDAKKLLEKELKRQELKSNKIILLKEV